MKNKCLYCYGDLDDTLDFHQNCAKEFFGTTKTPVLDYSLEQMEELARNVVEFRVSVPGVQAKLSMSVVKNATTANQARLTVVGALGGNYILKPPSAIYPEMVENEHLTMRIAQAFGIKVVPSSFIRLASGELCYLTKRIDRSLKGQKIHMLDMFQITEAYDKYKGSMEKIGKALGDYSSNTLLDKTYLFDLTLFSFITGNNDMHLKNFSMIESGMGWILAPAYDLLNVSILLPEDTEELALTLVGKRKKFKRGDFEEFGLELGLSSKQISSAFDRLFKNKSTALEWVQKSALSNELKKAYIQLLEDRYARLKE